MPDVSDAGLPREARLRGRDAFGRIFRQGDGLRRGDLVLKYIVQHPGAGAIRAGFVVRRAVGSAVRRNRVRRLLREAYRLQRGELAAHIPGDCDVELLIMFSGDAETARRIARTAIDAQMRAALGALAKRLRIRSDGT